METPAPANVTPKPALTSKTVLGALVALALALLSFFDIHVADEQAEEIITAAAALFAIYGRFKAKQPLTVIPPKTGAALLLGALFLAGAALYLTGCGTVESVAFDGTYEVVTCFLVGLVIITITAVMLHVLSWRGADRGDGWEDDE